MLMDIVVVTYGSSLAVPDCLHAMLETVEHYEDVNWIFIDNTSENSIDAQFLKTHSVESDNLTILERPDNPGFAGGCNYGASFGNADWIVLLNPDLVIDSNIIGKIRELALAQAGTSRSVAIPQRTGGRVHAGVAMNRFGWFTDRAISEKSAPLGPSGGAALYPRSVFESLEGFKEDLFAWGEDAELAMRLNLHEYECIEADFVIEHLGGHSIAGNDALTAKKHKLLLSNRFSIAQYWYPPSLKVKFSLFALFVVIAKTPIYIKSGAEWPILKILFFGLVGLARTSTSPTKWRLRNPVDVTSRGNV